MAQKHRKAPHNPERMPSEVDRLDQRAMAPTRERTFGGMATEDPFGMMGMSRLDQSRQPPGKATDGLGAMTRGMGGTRDQNTTPAAPPEQRKRRPGSI